MWNLSERHLFCCEVFNGKTEESDNQIFLGAKNSVCCIIGNDQFQPSERTLWLKPLLVKKAFEGPQTC